MTDAERPDSNAATDARQRWRGLAMRIASPVLRAAAAGELSKRLPEDPEMSGAGRRRKVAAWEALTRTAAGIAPLAEVERRSSVENGVHHALRTAISVSCNSTRRDFEIYPAGQRQPLVDTAFLALALLRAPQALFADQSADDQSRIVDVLDASRGIVPHQNNWLAFCLTVEAARARLHGTPDLPRAEMIWSQFEAWYVGDGLYADGPVFALDYYNSIVMLPMLLAAAEGLSTLGDGAEWSERRAVVLRRAGRVAEQLERMIGPDGTFPPLGRSLVYRGGLFHLLAHLALSGGLPPSLPPAQVRAALDAALANCHAAPQTFDEGGWLRAGLNGHQPKMAERYISVGSLYLTCTGFLPLGLTSDDPFWSDPDVAWTQKVLWTHGNDIGPDRALKT